MTLRAETISGLVLPGVCMQWQNMAGSLVVGCLLVVGGLLCVLRLQRRLVQQAVFSEIRGKFASVDHRVLTAKARFLGLDRSWDARWRGSGVLVITDHMLYFRLWRRDLDLTIPLECIQQVGISARDAQGTRRRPPLQVIYQGADGVSRTASWRVRDPQDHVRIIRDRLVRMDHHLASTSPR
jgi:hypothetical protein